MEIKDFQKVSDFLWEIPQSFRSDMRVPARIYASGKLLEDVFRDESLKQLVNTTTLPGIVKYALAMPDIHEGYGFPIGGVVATKYPDGVISPGGVGFDINCGVRLLLSDLTEKEITPFLDKLATRIQEEVPSGLGRGREKKISISDINFVLREGVQGLVKKKGFGEEEDIENCEAKGKLDWADEGYVSEKAKNRGRDQLGTLGSGNHFLEVQKVDEVYDKDIAEKFGLFEGKVCVMIHTGSRGLGHQIATDYIRVMMRAMEKYKIFLPDRELAAVSFETPEGQNYFKAMASGANFAWSNRHMVTFYVRKAWKFVLGADKKLKLLYDVAHNIAKIEEHEIEGERIKLIVHRKGATRAFPPERPELPVRYQKTGQPVLIPGSMGTASYVLVGTTESKNAFYTVNHGAGRTMSRRKAIKTVSGKEVVENLKRRGILVKSYSMKGVAEEAPIAYKDIDEVIEVVDRAGLAKKVARLVPLAVIKGE